MGNPNKVKVGPGLLYVNAVGEPEPADLTTPWTTVDAGWAAIGYTGEGHSFSKSPSFEGIDVAEETLPIRYEQTGDELTLSFAAAEMTVENLSRAFNGGTVTTLSGTVKRFDPPEVGSAT